MQHVKKHTTKRLQSRAGPGPKPTTGCLSPFNTLLSAKSLNRVSQAHTIYLKTDCQLRSIISLRNKLVIKRYIICIAGT